MSFWTDLRDTAEILAVGPLASDSANNKAGALFNKITGNPSAAEKREQANMVNEQIRAYKDQTAITEKQIADVQSQKLAEKRRINEKQIRSLRGSYRPAGGFLSNQSNTQLSGTSGLPNKLGTA